MTNIGHFRAAGRCSRPSRVSCRRGLWVAPPTKMDAAQLTAEGYYSIYGKAGARTEMPGCSLCMGNQARVADKATVVSTSTRNFPNRLGKGADVFLASAELATRRGDHGQAADAGGVPRRVEEDRLDRVGHLPLPQLLGLEALEEELDGLVELGRVVLRPAPRAAPRSRSSRS